LKYIKKSIISICHYDMAPESALFHPIGLLHRLSVVVVLIDKLPSYRHGHGPESDWS
jgi:hypothetical protein